VIRLNEIQIYIYFINYIPLGDAKILKCDVTTLEQ
jgi:hypothetical protein